MFLTCFICVLTLSQGRSSAKRKGLLEDILTRAKHDILVLLIDMKVRWSSTYAMLKRAYLLKDVRRYFTGVFIILANMDKFLGKFIYDVAAEEPDLDKRANLKLLKLSPEEWKRVQIFIKLLEVRTCLLLPLLRK